MTNSHGRFVWYELMTPDIEAASAFYVNVVGWGTRDASMPKLAYTLFTIGGASVGGLINLPEDARKMGAEPRWIGYVSSTTWTLASIGLSSLAEPCTFRRPIFPMSAASQSLPILKWLRLFWSSGGTPTNSGLLSWAN